MFKKIILIFLVVMTLTMTLTSCSKKSDNTAEIQLWYYNYSDNLGKQYYDRIMNPLIIKIKLFCEQNNIPLKVYISDDKIVSYEEYLLKRNLAAATGNLIVIEDVKYLWDLANQHADYTKLKSYNKLLDEYKNRFCIPIGVEHFTRYINRDILDYYNMKVEESFITYDKYLEIKQEMKEKGAKFYMNKYEYKEMLEYYKIKYDLMYVNDTSEILRNTDMLKAALKSCIIDAYEDIIKYNDSGIIDLKLLEKKSFPAFYDENSEINTYYQPNPQSILYRSLTYYKGIADNFNVISDRISVILPFTETSRYSPCFYMYKKITNQKIYEVADYIINENMYGSIFGNDHTYSPVFTGEKIRDTLELDENLRYIGEYRQLAEQGSERYEEISNYIDEMYASLNNKETRNIMANYYFSNINYYNKITEFLENTVAKLSENKFDYQNVEINKMLDDDIDEFILNFNIMYK